MADPLPSALPHPQPNPLLDLHRQAGAEFQAYADVEIVSTFGEPQAEYAAIRKGCAIIDLPQRGVLELTGKDRLPFLNNLLTNQTWDKAARSGLSAGQGVYAFLLNVKGRIVADLNVLERGDRTLLEMDGRVVGTVQKALEKYLFAEQVKMAGRVGSLHGIALHGPGAAGVLGEVAEGPATAVDALQPLASTSARLFGVDATVWRDDPAGVPGFHILVDAAAARTVWMNLIARFYDGAEPGPGKRKLRPAGWAAFNATRVEAGRPLFDVDFGNSADPDHSSLPAETGPATFSNAISLTKGCYLGQEIVARMHARGQVARQVVGLRMEDDSLPFAGSPIYDAQQSQIGVVTSSTISPVLSNAAICLGYVKKPHFEMGTTVHVPAEGAVRKATVVRTPFV